MTANSFQEKLMELFDKNLNSQFTINQIAKMTDFDYGYVNREMNKLIKKGIIGKKTVGNAHLCSLNLKNDGTMPLVFEKEIHKRISFYNKHKVLKGYFSDFLKEAEQYSIHSALIFGSYAKGAQTERSDLDLLVIIENKQFSSKTHNALNNAFKLSTLEVNPIIISRKEFLQMLSNKAKLNIGKEALKNHIIVYGIERFWEIVLEAESNE